MTDMQHKLKHYNNHLEPVNATSCRVWKRMDKQRNTIVKQYIKCSNCLPLTLTHALSLNRHWSIAWSMTVCCTPHQLSIRRRLNSLTSHSGCGLTHTYSTAKIL